MSSQGQLNLDKFQVRKLYANALNNFQYMDLPMTIAEAQSSTFLFNLNNRIFNNQILTRKDNEDGINIDYWEPVETGTNFTLAFLTTSGAPTNNDCGTPHSTLIDRKYVHTAQDWRNVEFTIFFRIIDITNDSAEVQIENRTGFHPTNGICCNGSGYAARMYLGNNAESEFVSLVREVFHNLYEEVEKGEQTLQGNIALAKTQYVGMKFVTFNQVVGGQTQVVNELWLCPSDSASDRQSGWIRVRRKVDFEGAGWGTGATTCGAPTDDYPQTWGSFRCMVQFIFCNSIRFKYISCREIDPFVGFGTGGGSPGTPPVPSCPPGYQYHADSNKCLLVSGAGDNIIYEATAWENANPRTISSHEERDPDDDRVFISAGDNRNLEFLGDGYVLLSGARSRIYILAANYNGSMEFKYTPNSTIENLSLRGRSRHNEGGSCSNAFGGYSCILRLDHVDFGDEECHDGGSHRDFGDNDLPNDLVNGTEYDVRFSWRDIPGNQVELKLELQGGAYGTSGWVEVGSAIDDDPATYMITRSRYIGSSSKYDDNVGSYCWIRSNNEDTTPTDVKIGFLIIRDLDGTPGLPPVVDPTFPDGGDPPGEPDPPPTGGGGNGGGDPPVPGSGVSITEFKTSWTMSQDLINDVYCQCQGAGAPGGGGEDPGTGGGGSGTFDIIFDNLDDLDTDDAVRLASTGSKTSYYLEYGMLVNETFAPIIGRKIRRMTYIAAEKGKPRGSSVDGIRAVIKHRSDHPTTPNGEAVVFSPIVDDNDLHDLPNYTTHIVTELSHSHAIEKGDRILFQYDGGDSSNYVKLFDKGPNPPSGMKVTLRDNDMSTNTFRQLSRDMILKIEVEKTV